VLVEDAAPQCCRGHPHNVPAHSEDEEQGKCSGEPRGGRAERASQLEVINADTKHGENGRACKRRTHPPTSQDNEGKRHKAPNGK